MKKNLTNYATKMLGLTAMAFVMMLPMAFCQEPAIDNDLITYSMAVSPDQQVKFRLPKDIRSGDMITGTVIEQRLLPYSPTDSFPYTNIDPGKVARSSSTLEGMVIEIDGKQTKLTNLVSFIVPAGLTSIPFLLKNSAGEVIERGQIPVGISSSSIPNSLPQQFVPDPVSQPGQMLRIKGAFDGNASNTRVSFNGKPMETLAESPRETFAQVSENATAGVSNISIVENNIKEDHKINIARLDLTASKMNLQRGQKATIQATITGLENIPVTSTNFKLRLENQSPLTISFLKEGGNVIEREINTGDIKNGQYTFSTKIIAQTTGTFSVQAVFFKPVSKNPCVDDYYDCVKSADETYASESKKCGFRANGNTLSASTCQAALIKAREEKKAECLQILIRCMRN